MARDITAYLHVDGRELRVLDGVSLTLAAGTVTDLVGPSGAGKTTLLRALARLLPHAHGTLALDGMPAERLSPEEWRAAVTLAPQRVTLAPGDVRSNLLLPWTLGVRRHAEKPSDAVLRDALDRVGLGGVAHERDATRLSVGQAARVALLRAVLARPRVLLLDEPDASLDDESALAVTALTRDFAGDGGAVLRVRHLRTDGLAGRRLRLEHGLLSEVAS